MGDIAIQEAKRCLKCKKPRCSQGCPIGTAVPEVFTLFLNGEIEKAGKVLFDNNPLSLICSYVCPHERQCEGSCILNAKGMPIQVSEVEKYISSFYLDHPLKNLPEIDRRKKVAIIGSGPAGITIAITLALRGFDVTIFELHDKIGGVMMYGIPEFRLPKEVLRRFKARMRDMGIKIRPNIMIGTAITIDDMFADGYKAVFMGTGVWRPRSLKIKGETLGHVHYAIDYLKNPASYELGKSLFVIGAGNVAIDVARTAIRNGVHNVTIIYRGSEQHMSALPSEIEYARFDGVKFEFFKKPAEITDDGIKYIQTRLSDNGSIEDIPGTEGFFPCDSVIVAIGQGPQSLIVNSTKGINVNSGGLVVTDDFGRTTKEGVFSSGDVVTGAKTVVEAVVEAKKVADAIEQYVNAKIEQQNNG
ncbi:MAG TPA: dihydropyrimidine dehydrogenase [Ruminococcaceae bacterium]|nr:dihydropyrimidine dehydrogenase [Oscillospiraceae bacterium]